MVTTPLSFTSSEGYRSLVSTFIVLSRRSDGDVYYLDYYCKRVDILGHGLEFIVLDLVAIAHTTSGDSQKQRLAASYTFGGPSNQIDAPLAALFPIIFCATSNTV